MSWLNGTTFTGFHNLESSNDISVLPFLVHFCLQVLDHKATSNKLAPVFSGLGPKATVACVTDKSSLSVTLVCRSAFLPEDVVSSDLDMMRSWLPRYARPEGGVHFLLCVSFSPAGHTC